MEELNVIRKIELRIKKDKNSENYLTWRAVIIVFLLILLMR